jgi:hypothetical protein
MGSSVQRDDFGGWTRLALNRTDELTAFAGERG